MNLKCFMANMLRYAIRLTLVVVLQGASLVQAQAPGTCAAVAMGPPLSLTKSEATSLCACDFAAHVNDVSHHITCMQQHG